MTEVARLRAAMIAVLGDDEVSTVDGSMSVSRAADLVAAALSGVPEGAASEGEVGPAVTVDWTNDMIANLERKLRDCESFLSRVPEGAASERSDVAEALLDAIKADLDHRDGFHPGEPCAHYDHRDALRAAYNAVVSAAAPQPVPEDAP